MAKGLTGREVRKERVRSEDRLADIRRELQDMNEAEVRVLQLLVEERLVEIVSALPVRGLPKDPG